MIILSKQGADFIKSWEKLSLVAYRPVPCDPWTIGFGHIDNVKQGDHISIVEAGFLFSRDIQEMIDHTDPHIHTTLTQNQMDAVISFVFNIGPDAFIRSTALRYINSGNLSDVPAQFQRWVHLQDGSISAGLANRRQSESIIWSLGVYKYHQ